MKPDAVRRWRVFLIGLGVYLLIILLFSSDSYVMKFKKADINFRDQFFFYAERWLSWAILTPLIFVGARKVRFSAKRWPAVLAIHAAGAAVFTLLQSLAFLGLSSFDVFVGLRDKPGIKGLKAAYLTSYQYNFLVYFVIVGVAVALDYYRRSRANELKAAQLETRLAGAELQALRVQVHPHFLFNTLHAVSALVHRDPDAADRMINRLSEMFRLSLETSGAQEVPLESELETLAPYLEIMDMRFGDRLRVVLDFPAETQGALIPNLILQPLLENAVRHGVAPKPDSGTVTVRGHRNGDRLIIEVADDGPGFPGESPDIFRNGLGLSNTKERLALLYGKDQSLQLGRSASGGARVVLDIPFRTIPPPHADSRP